MRTFLSVGLGVVLLGCAQSSIEQEETLPIIFENVTFPADVTPTGELPVVLRYVENCMASNPRVSVVSRTGSQVQLAATEQVLQQRGVTCPPVYIERTLSYTDPGTPARNDPFEVIVNGKSWGKVHVR